MNKQSYFNARYLYFMTGISNLVHLSLYHLLQKSLNYGNSPKNAQERDPVNGMKTETKGGLQGFLTFHKQLEIQQSHKTSFIVPIGSGERGLNKITTLPRKKAEHKPIFLLT